MIGYILLIIALIVFVIIPAIVLIDDNYHHNKLIKSAKSLLDLLDKYSDSKTNQGINIKDVAAGFCEFILRLRCWKIISDSKFKKYQKEIRIISEYLGVSVLQHWATPHDWKARIKILNDIINE